MTIDSHGRQHIGAGTGFGRSCCLRPAPRRSRPFRGVAPRRCGRGLPRRGHGRGRDELLLAPDVAAARLERDRSDLTWFARRPLPTVPTLCPGPGDAPGWVRGREAWRSAASPLCLRLHRPPVACSGLQVLQLRQAACWLAVDAVGVRRRRCGPRHYVGRRAADPSALLAPALASVGDRIYRGTALVIAHGAVAVAHAAHVGGASRRRAGVGRDRGVDRSPRPSPSYAPSTTPPCRNSPAALDEGSCRATLVVGGERLALFLGPGGRRHRRPKVSGPSRVLAISFASRR